MFFNFQFGKVRTSAHSLRWVPEIFSFMISKTKTLRENSASLLSKALHEQSFRSVSKGEKNDAADGKTRYIHFFTTCPESWGGSEELWARTARQLAAMGFQISANFVHLDLAHPEVIKLIEAGVHLEKYQGVPVLRRSSIFRKRWEGELTVARLQAQQPHLAIIAQGENIDGRRMVSYCRQAAIPYVIICQKASDDMCPMDYERTYLKESLEQAQRVFFVSEHNRTVTEERLGFRLTNGEVISNPFKVDRNIKIPWPELDHGRFQLACLARLWVRDKGQDLLLKVMAQEKWKKREIDINLYGHGPNGTGLKEMAQLLGVTQVHFRGFSPDVEEIWRRQHALILPSRHEGLPLALVEAMLCERPAIVTDAGGNAEVVDDEVNGFLAPAPTVAALDDAMERAWKRRADWQQMGVNAGISIRKKVPEDPSGIFTNKILEIYSNLEKTRQP
jgi:glycosyltransferase involved in cell wall biosynthesis